MVQLVGIKPQGVKTAIQCRVDGAAGNIGDSSDELQQRDRLACTNFAFTIHS